MACIEMDFTSGGSGPEPTPIGTLEILVPALSADDGNVTYTGTPEAQSTYPIWKGFSRLPDNGGGARPIVTIVGGTEASVGYHFPSKVLVKGATYANLNDAGSSYITKAKLQGRNSIDDQWVDLSEIVAGNGTPHSVIYIPSNDDTNTLYEYVRILAVEAYRGGTKNNVFSAYDLRFYGFTE